MSSHEAQRTLSDEHGRMLLDVAAAAIEHGLRTGRVLEVDSSRYPEPLRAHRATFVTVDRDGRLLGCIGTIHAQTSAVEDVAKNAHGAVLFDPRCPKLEPDDVADLRIHISLLTEPAPMAFASEEDLVRQLRPGVDGLLLEDGFYRGTFLPVVWESLPDPRDFLRHLKQKAGLPPTYWSDTVRVSRYTTEVIE
jgi:AmmeMemoRadiSam system protein A